MDRMNLLANARANAKSCMDNGIEPPVETLNAIESVFQIGEIQYNVIKDIQDLKNNQEDLVALNAELLNANQLFKIVQKFGLTTEALAILHCANHREDRSLIKRTWDSIIEDGILINFI